MLENLKIGTRLGLRCGLLLGMTAGVAMSGYWATSGLARPTVQLFQKDGRAGEEIARVHAGLQVLRRQAKMILVSIHSPQQVAASRKQWDEARAGQAARLDELEKSATRAEDKESVMAMRQELAAYDANFTRLLGLIQEGMVKTPQSTRKAGHAGTRSSQF